MMGKLANVMRWAITVAVGGSSGCTRDIAAFTYCSVWNMSRSQEKNRSISADPRLVMERTSCSPGTLFTASSMGRVMVTIIWSVGMTPLSTAIRIRGKFVAGKTATGLEWRANQYLDSGWLTGFLRCGYFSFWFSILILALSGRP